MINVSSDFENIVAMKYLNMLCRVCGSRNTRSSTVPQPVHKLTRGPCKLKTRTPRPVHPELRSEGSLVVLCPRPQPHNPLRDLTSHTTTRATQRGTLLDFRQPSRGLPTTAAVPHCLVGGGMPALEGQDGKHKAWEVEWVVT